ncbi:MAG TPA: transposase, partial [Bacteroidales bacterium]|nr:transposase [Bacteroidales bacterium]
ILKNRLLKMLLNFLSQISWQIQLIRELLTSERGLMHRSKRPVEPEAVFGQIKYDSGFKRFMLKSLPKVSVEFGLVALAHNLRKYASNLHSILTKKYLKNRFFFKDLMV